MAKASVVEKKRNSLFLSFLILFSTQFSAIAKPVSFVVDDELGRDNVSFTSDAPIELIIGRTTKVKGEIVIDDSLDLKKVLPKVSFEVDLASIGTGIPLRDQHMRDNFLETQKYPKATFVVKSIEPDSDKLVNGGTVKLKAKGNFTVHGVTVQKEISVQLNYLKESDFTHNKFEHGDLIRIRADFEVPLEEHKIQRPEVLKQKLANTAIVFIDAFAHEKKEDKK